MDIYKKTFSAIHASDELKEKVKNMPEETQKTWRVPAKWAVAAATVAVLMLCAGFHSQLQTFAEKLFFKNTTVLEDKTVEAKMDVVEIKHVDKAAWDKKYNTMEDVEELLGISLLKSDEAYTAPIPSIELGSYENGEVVKIYDNYYVTHNVVMDLEQDENGDVFRSTDDGAYGISYSASFYAEYGAEDKYIAEYTGATFVEDFTTANGMTASIYRFGGEYCAVIYHDNICYTFETTTQQGTVSCKTFIEEFLDTLK
jgi:hypothetical protein